MKDYLERFGTWSNASVVRRIFSAALTVGALAIASRLITAAKDILVANHFGTSTDLGVFLIAYLLPMTIVSVVAGSYSSALVPTFVRLREKAGQAEANVLFAGVMWWGIALLLLTTAGLATFATPILTGMTRLSGERLDLARQLLSIMLPLLPLGGVTAIWAAVLNASERFAMTGLAPIATPLVIVVCLVAAPQWGVHALAIGTTVGALVQGVLLGTAVWRANLPLVPRWRGMSPAMRDVIHQYFPMLMGAFVFSGTSTVDQTIAARMGAGTVAVLSYGNKSVAFATGIGSLAIGTAVLPHFSRLVATGDLATVKRVLVTYSKLIAMVTVPATGVLVLLSHQLVVLLFQRGAFTAADSYAVSRVQMAYACQMPFYLLTILGVRLMSALMMNRLILVIASLNFILNWVLDVVLARLLGVPGIAVSTSVVALFSCTLVYLCIVVSLRRMASARGGPSPTRDAPASVQ